jgi:hypothetical protein
MLATAWRIQAKTGKTARQAMRDHVLKVAVKLREESTIYFSIGVERDYLATVINNSFHTSIVATHALFDLIS